VTIAEIPHADVDHLPGDLTEAEALDITSKIARTGEHLSALIQSAWRGRVWVALGHNSWAEWAEVHLAGMQLPRIERREVVAELHAEGMSNRAIATAIGVDEITVRRQVSGATNVAPRPADTEPQADEDDIVEAEVIDTPNVTIGLDGKTYTRPAPKVLTAEEQHEADLVENDARMARYVEKAISNWPALYGLRTHPRRERIIACLCEPDREQLQLIEERLK
jgi:hypothetical protein